MISFVSTFPPAMCGIGTYTEYLTVHMPQDAWEVIAFQLDEFSRCPEATGRAEEGRIRYWISLAAPCLPPLVRGDVLWFQHSFGMWGRVNTHFLKLIEEAKERGKRVVASFHTIHFQSGETPWGMQEKEWRLLEEALPLLDCATVFTQGAYQAVVRAFPRWREKVVVLRHGVHSYPGWGKEEARRRFFRYLIEEALLPSDEKAGLKEIERSLTSGETVLLGNFGFITRDKDPLRLYELRRLVQARLPNYRVITLFIGQIQERKDKSREASLPILTALRQVHDGRENLFYEDYLPERIFPIAFACLDFAVFWCDNATQSGRMAHAQGAGVSIAGRKWEGIGETLELSGLPATETLEDLAEQISEMVKDPNLRATMAESSRRYAQRFSFPNQAKKHLLLEKALREGLRPPLLDGEVTDDTHTEELGARRFERFGESGGWAEVRP